MRAFPSELNSPESSILLHPGFVPPIIWYMKNMTEEKWIKIGKAALSIVKGIRCAKLLQSHLTLCDAMDYSLPGSSVHEIFQAGILE